jgi:hypothetical protein
MCTVVLTPPEAGRICSRLSLHSSHSRKKLPHGLGMLSEWFYCGHSDEKLKEAPGGFLADARESVTELG